MSAWIDVAGWTLVHFVWQGMLAGSIAASALRLLRGASPQLRYLAGCAALAAMLGAPLVTASVLAGATAAPGSRGVTPLLQSPGVSRSTGLAAAAATQGSPAQASTSSRPAGSRNVSIEAWLPAVVAVWLVGVTFLLARLAGGWLRLHRVHRASLGALPSRWEQASSRIAILLGIDRLVRVIDSPFVDTPTVIGWMRPVILLPVAALANLSPPQVEAILAHELAHVRRHDFLMNCMQAFAETLLFYHPAVWWLSARIRAEREQCCDLVAVEVCGDAVIYAEALAELETWRVSGTELALAATGGALLERIRRLLRVPSDDTPRFSAVGAVAPVALLMVLAIGATHYLRAARADSGAAAVDDATPAAGDAVAWRMVFDHRTTELNIMGFTGRDLVRFAYQLPKARVVGGPSWIDDETFRIVVKLDERPELEALLEGSAAPDAANMPSIVQRVLEKRFQLRTHVERRRFPAYALMTARPDKSPGPNLRVSTVDCFDVDTWIAAGQPPREWRANAQRQPVCGEQSWDSTISRTSYVAITMPELAAGMRGFSRARLAAADGDWPDRRDVVDRTGLAGRYDIDIHAFLPAAALMGRYPLFKLLLEPLGLPSIERALEQQLGLKLVETTAPYDVIVIDSAERPVALTAVQEQLGPRPTESSARN
jgi:uncharacterized protein (TIGR03435 family)